MQNLTETDDFLFILKKYQIGKKKRAASCALPNRNIHIYFELFIK
ncbi:hypothetical protein EBA29_02367 [Bacillus velezensis]|nr:hypothetical protein BCBMB205_23340 [Bacillus velezensis]EIF13846.1 hypothetical protein MY7_2178 [Bacillus sp. 5B6]SLB17221.1 Uncharacterised protein [Mycobacteroides abscessus subsp. massiliense]GFR56048.1 hypothetical protein MY7_2178 [Bacillus sp. CN2]ARZ58673.1 hypothetical protein BAGQ_2440 [Bacillus velezensis]